MGAFYSVRGTFPLSLLLLGGSIDFAQVEGTLIEHIVDQESAIRVCSCRNPVLSNREAVRVLPTVKLLYYHYLPSLSVKNVQDFQIFFMPQVPHIYLALKVFNHQEIQFL